MSVYTSETFFCVSGGFYGSSCSVSASSGYEPRSDGNTYAFLGAGRGISSSGDVFVVLWQL